MHRLEDGYVLGGCFEQHGYQFSVHLRHLNIHEYQVVGLPVEAGQHIAAGW